MSNPSPNHSSERGQTALFMTMTLTISLGLIGLVVDQGWGYWRQEACVTAAQSAAIGGIMWALNKNSTWPPATCTAGSAIVCQATPTACPPNPVQGDATSDVDAACKYAMQNGFKATGKQNVTIAANTGNAPTATGANTAYYITVRASEQIPLTFLSAVVGRVNNIVSGRATAAVISTAAGDCVYVLDPSGNAALNLSNGAQVQSECGYWINSNGSTALSVTGGTLLKALNGSTVNLKGGYTNANGGTISPMPTPSAVAPDPFISRNVPLQRSATGGRTYTCDYGAAGGCSHTSTATYKCEYNNFVQSATVTSLAMTPGVYCGGIQITGNAGTVTFAPGVYILDGGGMALTGGGTSIVASGGVSFFNTGTNATYKGITIGNGVPATLAASTSGAMAGLLFYQDPSITPTPPINATTTSFFNGGSSLALAGSLYFPNTALNWSNGTSSTTAATALVAYDVTFTGGAYFKHDGTNITSLGGANKIGMVE